MESTQKFSKDSSNLVIDLKEVLMCIRNSRSKLTTFAYGVF